MTKSASESPQNELEPVPGAGRAESRSQGQGSAGMTIQRRGEPMNQLTEEQRKTLIRNALTIAQRVCHGHFCDSHPMGQAEVCKLTTEAISLLDSQAAGNGLVKAAAIYREGLDRIWRLLDLTLERAPGDVATLQKTAHDYLVRGNTADADAIMEKARQLAVDISGDYESAREVQTIAQAWRVIDGALRDGKLT